MLKTEKVGRQVPALLLKTKEGGVGRVTPLTSEVTGRGHITELLLSAPQHAAELFWEAESEPARAAGPHLRVPAAGLDPTAVA